MRPAEPLPPRPRVAVGVSYALLLVVAGQLAVWESFFVGARPWGLALPVSAAAAVVGNLALGRAGGRLLGTTAGAAMPGICWGLVALGLALPGPRGDVVVTGDLRGLSFLVAGLVAAGVAAAPRKARNSQSRATPEAGSGR